MSDSLSDPDVSGSVESGSVESGSVESGSVESGLVESESDASDSFLSLFAWYALRCVPNDLRTVFGRMRTVGFDVSITCNYNYL